MKLEELTKKTTIKFPRPLNLGEAEKLLNYIAEQLPANINYHISQFRSIYHTKEKIEKQEGTVDITATISATKKLMAFDTALLRYSEQDTSKLAAISFQLIPGLDIFDYRPEVIQLWELTRKVVEQYFK